MVFIAELFWWFENVKPDFVQPRDIQEIKDGKFVTRITDTMLFKKYLDCAEAVTKWCFLGSFVSTQSLFLLGIFGSSKIE